MLQLWSNDTKIGCISKRNQLNQLVFDVLIKIHVEDYGNFKTERAFVIQQ